MKKQEPEVLKVYPERRRLVVYVPDRRGEELRIHLASNGITATIGKSVETPLERLEVDGGTDAETLQAVLDHWER